MAHRKQTPKDSYEQIIWDLLEDIAELCDETQNDIKTSRKQISKGEFVTHAQLKKKIGL